MSRETLTHLNTQTLIGYTSKRGQAWHYRAENQGAEPNHYEHAVPVADVRRLFHWSPVEADVQAVAIDDTAVQTYTDPTRKAIVRPDTGAILGIFRTGYKVHDYDRWLITNVEGILDADLHIGSAGLLRGGAVAWVQVEMVDTLNAAGAGSSGALPRRSPLRTGRASCPRIRLKQARWRRRRLLSGRC